MDSREKIKLLIWKNAKTSLWLYAFGQLVLCLFASIILIQLHNMTTTNERRFTKTAIRYPPISVSDLSALRAANIPDKSKVLEWKLAYTPENEIVKQLVDGAAAKLDIKTEPFSRDKLTHTAYLKKYLAAVSFPATFDNITALPVKLSYLLRFPGKFRTSHSDQLLESVWITRTVDVTTAQEKRTEKDLDVYVTEGFLAIEHALFEVYVEMALKTFTVTNNLDNGHLPKIYVQNFPFPPKAESLQLEANSDWIEFIFFVSYIWPILNLVWIVSRENQDNVKVFLKIYGIEYWMHWVAHFAVFMIQFQGITILLICMGKIQWTSDPSSAFFNKSNVIMIWIFMTFYNAVVILFGFIVSTIIPRVRPAVTFTILIILLLRGIFSIILEHSENLSSFGMVICLFYFNNVLSLFIHYVFDVEMSDHKFSWSHINPRIGSAGYFFLMIILEFLVYLFVLYYVQSLKPGAYVSRKNWDFVCFATKPDAKPGDEIPPKGVSPEFVEHGPVFDRCAIKITRLRKVKNKKSIVQNLSMRMYENEATIILGHNGSGKTTTLTMLAGLRLPTYGTVDIYNEQISTEVSSKFLGICPSNNALFQHISIENHIRFYLKVKECPQAQFNTEVKKCLELMTIIGNDADHNVSTLSYDDQRIFCLVLALACNSKVILCDEPTIHMSAEKKLRFWDILRDHKKNRCIVVATHCIDEAKTLGDRIAILSEGNLKCYGTPYFLKKRLGGGYNLFIVKREGVPTENITKFLKTFVPKITPENEIGDQVHFKIPEQHIGVFSKMLSKLEAKRDELNIVTYGILSGRLEEVYMNVGMKKNPQLFYEKEISALASFKALTGWALIQRQIIGMAYKRMIHQAPNILPLLVCVLSFLLMILLGKLAATSISGMYRYESISMDLKHLKDTVITLEVEPRIRDSSTFNYKFWKAFSPIVQKMLDDDLTLEEISEKFDDYMLHDVDADKKLLTLGGRSFGQSGFEIWATGRRYVATTIGQTDLTAWYNGQHFHTASLSLNFLHNMLLKTIFNESFSVSVSNKPLNMSIESKFEFLNYDLAHLELPLTVGTIIPFMINAAIVFLVVERRTRVRDLQFIAGIKVPVFYLVGLLWDWLNYIVFSTIFTTAIYFINIDGVNFIDKLRILMLLIIFGFPGICSVYLLSMLFTDSLTAYFGASAISLFTGLFAYVLFSDLLEFNAVFHWIALASPNFALLDAIGLMFKTRKEHEFCEEERELQVLDEQAICKRVEDCCDTTVYKWEYPGIYPNILYLIITGTLFFVAIFCLEYYEKVTRFNSKRVDSMFPLIVVDTNKDVLKEKAKICQILPDGKMPEYAIVVDQLETFNVQKEQYRTISFALKRSECLGILGVQKSGKTSVCLKLTGREGYSYGDVFVYQNDFKRDPASASRHIGYCAQNEGVLQEFSGREMICLLAIIRGVPERQINPLIRELSDAFGLRKIIAKKIYSYSFGDKRKLCMACSLVAGVSVLVVDEPTAGIDALSRRQIWNVLRYVRYCGKSIICTSTSAYECEILSDQALVFVEGGMKALGSLENLMAKFCSGFVLEVRLLKDGTTDAEVEENLRVDIQNMVDFSKFLSEDSDVRLQSDNILKIYIPVVKLDWAKMFGLMEKHKERLNIADYFISRMTLDEMLSTLDEQEAT